MIFKYIENLFKLNNKNNDNFDIRMLRSRFGGHAALGLGSILFILQGTQGNSPSYKVSTHLYYLALLHMTRKNINHRNFLIQF